MLNSKMYNLNAHPEYLVKYMHFNANFEKSGGMRDLTFFGFSKSIRAQIVLSRSIFDISPFYLHNMTSSWAYIRYRES